MTRTIVPREVDLEVFGTGRAFIRLRRQVGSVRDRGKGWAPSLQSRIRPRSVLPAWCVFSRFSILVGIVIPSLLAGLLMMTLFSSVTAAAPSGEADHQWPPVNPQELAMKDCLQSPGAPAVILYHEETWNDEKNTADFYFRIKVFTKPGEDYGKIEIPYFPQTDF